VVDIAVGVDADPLFDDGFADGYEGGSACVWTSQNPGPGC
jgi:hypothetical protein